MTTTTDDVRTVRTFNRTWTTKAGLLQAGLLDTPFPLAEARVLYELGRVPVRDVADLRRELSLDSGYLSRIIQRLRTAGLVDTEPSGADRRRLVARLTALGREACADLDRRSTDQVATLLEPFDDTERQTLLGAMDLVARAFGAERSRPGPAVTVDALGPGDLGWVVERHGALYDAEYGWDQTFEALVARIVADFVDELRPGRDAAWIARVEGRRVGCVFCVHADEQMSKLRLLLVDPAARGLGIGTRLVDECIAFARRSGVSMLALWTNDVLVAARRIYEAAGFVLVEEEPHHSFGHDLIGQTWHLDLT